ncbi:MAG: hypothetical protein ACR2P5_09665, partial [Gammaproteobacteria bacterium]
MISIVGKPKTGIGASLLRARDGEESAFSAEDYELFNDKLKEETELAAAWGVRKQYLPLHPQTLGCEVESCLIGDDGAPLPAAEQFMEYFANSNGYYEMAKFNMEFEIDPVGLARRPFSELRDSLENNRMHSSRCADMVGAKILLSGILPSLQRGHLTAEMVTGRSHFRALEKQLRLLNKNRPFHVNIGEGEDALHFDADNLSIEGAANSLQVHLSVEEPLSAAYYNAAQMVSALTAGIAANSPFLLGKRLWEETRVPLFEQIMYERFVGRNAQSLPYGRRCDDIFGHGYLQDSLLELFQDNFVALAALLPIARDDPPENMMHLILHNRDILRWNRPVLGFANNAPFLRIEHRVMPSGPTTADMTANMAFYTGLVRHLHLAFVGATARTTKVRMPFSAVRDNFYRAARDGLKAEIDWLGETICLRDLILGKALTYAERGLEAAGVDKDEIAEWLGIIRARADSGQNGSVWQQRFAAKHGADENGLRALSNAYWQ